ncbi:MAG: hypothetical protein V3R80_03780, partial [Candidatus Tectomicrobia bacterium]
IVAGALKFAMGIDVDEQILGRREQYSQVNFCEIRSVLARALLGRPPWTLRASEAAMVHNHA